MSNLHYGPKLRQLLLKLESDRDRVPPAGSERLSKLAFLGLLVAKNAKLRRRSSTGSLSSSPTLYSPNQRSRSNSGAVPGPLFALQSRSERSWQEKYSSFETGLLANLESLVSLFDNFTMFQNVLSKSRFASKFRGVEALLKNLSKVYFIIILINLKNLIVKLIKLNKLIRIVELEAEMLSRNDKNVLLPEAASQEREKLVFLYTEKFRTYVELVGYANELVLDLTLVYSRIRLPKLVERLVSLVSWIIGVYRLSKDEAEEARTEEQIAAMQKQYL
ncbi:hypothetical protein KL942_000957 [Ogataea angusta]|uniref:Uncharacterized protein n=1 Tax=Pichia angusta TaxID=870730 RepID=A0ABQ7S221_PICAN|nr:hypothetical protein KL942_000957 [Ogataea angusta]KAG7851986.1 hypothetical protein KL940_000868 [Ogataea angusta]KAG7853517.1 hypothetical protein KL941_000567 [Ogataea angusta]KAG7864193.1 hypothetical protein KL919_000221 [Ogataea angusta]